MTPVQELLAGMIAAPTVSSQPVIELAADVARRCEDLGFTVELIGDDSDPQKASVIGTLGPAGEDGLVISGHLDVVPVEGQPWSSDPFVMTERGGRLYGRGTADMKGFIACAIRALGRLPLARLRRQVVLIWTHDEELGCLGSAQLVPKLQGRRLPREALIGEPTDFRIFRMHPGHVAARVICDGASAHSSKPDLGASALAAMARVLLMLEDLQAELSREPRLTDFLERPFTVLNPAVIHGGSAVNMVPDRCELLLGWRPLPGDDPLEVARRIQTRLGALALPSGTGARLAVERVTPAMMTAPGGPLEGLLRPHAHPPEPAAASYATDGGNFERLGIRSLIFGPGSIDVAHKADEYVSIEALERGVDVVEAIVRARCLDPMLAGVEGRA